ncbi:Por secretion system C-terminal sorting domain-containing protein, partial [Pseudarcicella hirudinis]
TTTHAQLEYAKEKCLGTEVLPISYEPKGGSFSVNSTEAIIDSQTGKLETNQGGTFQITYSVNDNCGISKAVSEIAIISVEAPTALGAKACLGSQVSLIASGCENGGLLWFEENGTSVDMPITFSKSVNYYAKCRKGECLSEKSNLVSIEETTTTHAQLEYAKEKCLGSEVLPISYEPKGGIFTVNSTEASVDSRTGKLETNQGGTFQITYSVNDNCGISKAISEIAIILVEAPIVIGTKACLGSQVSLTASGCENGALLWFEENGTSVDMPITFSKSANYYAKCLKRECLSEKSNLVSIEETTTTHAQLEYAKEACIGATIFPQSFEPVGGTFVLISGNASVDPQTGKLEPLNSGVFTVEYVLNGDCGGDKASTNILVNPLPVANAGAGGTLSPSQVYDLASVQTASGGTAPYSFEWTASPNVTISPNAQSSNPKFTGFTTPDLIKLKIIDSKGCQASATASIGVRNCDLQVQILSKGSLCGNSGNNEVILSPSVTSGIAPFSYKWLKSQNIISQNQTLSVNDPGEYILEVEDAAGCQGKSGITVSRSTLSKPVVASETVKGSGSVTLVATNCNGSGVNWYDVNLQFLINSFTYSTPEITSPAKYYAQCVGDGCLSELTEVNVFFIPAPQAPQVKSAIVCGSGNMASLSASSCAGEINWYWAIKDEKPFSKDFSIMVGPITISSDVYVECIVNGVPSPRVRGFITLKDFPDNRTEVLGNTEICEGSFAVIRASGSAEIKAYQWKKEGRIIDGNQREFIARESGNYSVIVSSDGCTAESPQVRINVVQKPASPSIFAEGKSTVCEGNSVNIKAVVPSDSRENRWYKDGRLISYYENIATGESGRYELIVVNYLGCTSNASNPVLVNILPKPAAPQIIINGNDKFCSDGVSPELTTNFAYGYEWNSKNGLKSQSRSIKAGNKSDWFSLTIKDGNGCISHESSKEIIVFPLPHKPEINSIGKPEICVGEKLTIRTDSLPEITYLWSDHGKNHFENVISGQKSGFESISLSIKDLNNCISPVSENLIVKINPLPSKPIISANHSLDLCDGEAMKLYSAEAFKYHWNTGDTIRAIIVEKAGKYSLFTENVFGCKSEVSDSVSVIVRGKPQKPKVTVRGDLNFCEDGRKTILLSSPGLYYKWNTGDSAQAISVGTSGKYVLSIGNEYNCWSVLSDTIKIITYPLPGRPVISVMGDKTFCADSKTILSSTEEQEYLWNNGNTSRKIVVNKSGNYSLIVTNKFGCRSLKSEDIQIEVKTLPLSPALSVIGVYNLEAKSAEEGNGYEWKFEDRLLEDTSSVVKVVETGIYTARKKKAYMLSENNMLTCYSFPSVIKYVNKYASEREWFIYPNPNPGDKVIIETPDNLENVRILIYDFHGKLHLDGFVEKLDRRYALLINELTTGQYILKLISPEFEAAKLFYVIK